MSQKDFSVGMRREKKKEWKRKREEEERVKERKRKRGGRGVDEHLQVFSLHLSLLRTQHKLWSL